MKIKDRMTVQIPAWAMPYIFNADCSGIEDEDIKLVDDWFESLKKEGWGYPEISLVDHDADPSFTYCPEFGLPCDCYECEVVCFERE